VLPGPHKRYARYRDTIQALNQAVLARRTVRMRYRTGRTGKLGARKLDPYRVWYRSGGLYVIGHDHRSGEIRTFAVDRIREVEATEESFAVPSSFDFDAYTAASFGVVAEPAVAVRIRFDRSWAIHVEEHSWHPSQKLERRRDGSLDLLMEWRRRRASKLGALLRRRRRGALAAVAARRGEERARTRPGALPPPAPSRVISSKIGADAREEVG
jgi:predicted DNA-binding transcriptional regulator YafY